MMRALPLALLLVATLAGCSGEAPAATIQVCEGGDCIATLQTDTPEQASDIRGVVVDETIAPVADVPVTLWQGPEQLATLTTNEGGAFTLRGLPDGFYRLTTAREGYEPAETQLDVGAASIGTLRIQILSQPPIVPTHTLLKWDGIMGCSVRFVNGGAQACSLLRLVDPEIDNSYRTFYDEFIAPGRAPSWAQAELYWESNQVLGAALAMHAWRYSPSDHTARIGIAEGSSPQTLQWDAAAIHDNGLGQATNVSMPHGIYFQMWAGTDASLTPSVTFQQDFTLYLSLIYNATPPEGWTFLTHGELA